MRYNELGGPARSRALDNAHGAWRGRRVPGRRSSRGRTTACRTSSARRGLSGYGDVVRFEVGDLFVPGEWSDPRYRLTWRPGPAWDDGSRLVPMLEHLAANDVAGGLLEGVGTWADEDDLDRVAADALDGLASEVAVRFLNANDLADWEYGEVACLLESGEWELDFTEDGGIAS